MKERSIFLFNNHLLSDISFVVRASSGESEPKKNKMAIPAHKFMLSIRSPVFFAMFCGKMAEKSDTVDLPDCEYKGVLEMLRYLYSEEVKLNESNVMQVLYVAKKYMLPVLANECIDFLKRRLDVGNVFCVLSHAQQYDEKVLVDQCWEVIDRETEEVVKSEGFTTIERSLLEVIVKRDTLSISEVDLFKAVDLWATKGCERQGLATDGKVKRKILGEQIVKSIRFPLFKEEEFANFVLQPNILTNVEAKDLIKCLNGGLMTHVSFPEERRIGTFQSCCRFGSFVSCSNDPYHDEVLCWAYGSEDAEFHAIGLQVNNDVMLNGIRLLGCAKGAGYVVSMKIIDRQNNKELFVLNEREFHCFPVPFKTEKINGFDVVFDPLILKKNCKYVVRADISGPYCCCGVDGKNTIQSHGVTFHFRNLSSKKKINQTSIASGQFAGFFFKPL